MVDSHQTEKTRKNRVSLAINGRVLWQILQALWIALILMIGLPVLFWTLSSAR